MLSRKAKWRAKKLLNVAKNTLSIASLIYFIFFVFGGIFKTNLPPSLVNLFKGLFLFRLALIVIESLVYLYIYPDKNKISALSLALPEPIQKYVFYEKLVYENFFKSFFSTDKINLNGFTFSQGEKYNTLMYLIPLSMLIELPITYLIIRNLVHSPSVLLFIDLITAISMTYMVVFLRADFHAIRNTAHFLDEIKLSLCLGFRLSGTVDLNNITSIKPFNKEAYKSVKDRIKISPFDQPNVLIACQDKTIYIKKTLGGIKNVSLVALYVDQPQKLMEKYNNLMNLK